MGKNTVVVSVGVLTVVIVLSIAWYMRSSPSREVSDVTSLIATTPSPTPVSFPSREPSPEPSATTHRISQKFEAEPFRVYFKGKLLSQKEVARIYQEIRKLLSDSEASEFISMYGAVVAGRNETPEFSSFMSQLLTAMQIQSDQIFNELLAHEPALKSFPFAFQAALNLTAQLNLPSAKKAVFLGKALDHKFEIDANNMISPETASISIALIQMKHAGVTSEEAKIYIQKGIERNRDNPKGLKEFIARAKTYFPESF